MGKRILRADDKRRGYHDPKVHQSESGNGAAKRVSSIFHDRRGSHKNGHGKRTA